MLSVEISLMGLVCAGATIVVVNVVVVCSSCLTTWLTVLVLLRSWIIGIREQRKILELSTSRALYRRIITHIDELLMELMELIVEVKQKCHFLKRHQQTLSRADHVLLYNNAANRQCGNYSSTFTMQSFSLVVGRSEETAVVMSRKQRHGSRRRSEGM
jgi:hypothetical protein